jgi:hypothetical protein
MRFHNETSLARGFDTTMAETGVTMMSICLIGDLGDEPKLGYSPKGNPPETP